MIRIRKVFYERKRNGSEHVEHENPISIYIIKNTTHLIFIENVYSNRFSRVLCVPTLENKGKWWNT